MKIFFAGAEPKNHITLLKGMGVTNLLQSYYYLGKNSPVTDCELLLDSGGFTARTRGTEISVENYAKYLNDNSVLFAFNLDTNDLKETLRNQEYLEKHTSSYIIPIYHLSDYFHARELIQEFCKYPFISIGGVAGEKSAKRYKNQLYQYVFKHTRDKIMVHGLGITSEPDLKSFPWYSVDSTSWLQFQKFGSSSIIKSKRMAQYMAKEVHYNDQNKIEIAGVLKLEKNITALWAERGVTWDERPLRVQEIITKATGQGSVELQERRRRKVTNSQGSDS